MQPHLLFLCFGRKTHLLHTFPNTDLIEYNTGNNNPLIRFVLFYP